MTEQSAAPVGTLAPVHVDGATAYTVADDPYGFRLRCQQRHWIEHKPRHGFRHVTQTSNPKRPGTWNTPKPGTYGPVLVLTIDAAGHVGTAGLSAWADDEQIAAYEATHAAGLADEHRAALAAMRATNARLARVSYRVEATGYATIDGAGMAAHATKEEADAYRAGRAAYASAAAGEPAEEIAHHRAAVADPAAWGDAPEARAYRRGAIDGLVAIAPASCPECHGSGGTAHVPCDYCSGAGRDPEPERSVAERVAEGAIGPPTPLVAEEEDGPFWTFVPIPNDCPIHGTPMREGRYGGYVCDRCREEEGAAEEAPDPRVAVTRAGTAYLLPGMGPAPAKRGDAAQLAIF